MANLFFGNTTGNTYTAKASQNLGFEVLSDLANFSFSAIAKEIAFEFIKEAVTKPIVDAIFNNQEPQGDDPKQNSIEKNGIPSPQQEASLRAFNDPYAGNIVAPATPLPSVSPTGVSTGIQNQIDQVISRQGPELPKSVDDPRKQEACSVAA
jgi:hypothetical protein